MIKSSSRYIHRRDEAGWGVLLGSDIDACIAELSEDREVISVAVAPLTRSKQVPALGGEAFDTFTCGLIVTVVWKEPAE